MMCYCCLDYLKGPFEIVHIYSYNQFEDRIISFVFLFHPISIALLCVYMKGENT